MKDPGGSALPFEYEIRLRQDPDLAIREIGNYHEGRSAVDRTLSALCRTLEEKGIPYALMGALALAKHGFVRATTDIDLLMTKEGLEKFIMTCVGLGYVRAFSGAKKTFRATETGVRVEVLITGEYPGDGKPKPVSFPDPTEAGISIKGACVVRLEQLIQLKLASGMTASHRRQDLADVQRLIRETQLPMDLAERLDASVKDLYAQLWREAQTVDVHEQGGGTSP